MSFFFIFRAARQETQFFSNMGPELFTFTQLFDLIGMVFFGTFENYKESSDFEMDNI